MNIESQVTSLELSKILHRLGMKQESLFFWTEKDDYSKLGYGRSMALVKGDMIYYNNEFNSYSAFTASELLEFLPQYISINLGNPPLLYLKKDFVNWEIQYNNSGFHRIPSKPITDNNFINALAKMLIYLIENKLMEIK